MYLAKIALLAIAYFLTGQLGLLLAIPPGFATAIWPPSGIALAGILLLGYRYWPSVFLGSALVSLFAAFDTGSAAWLARCGGIALGAVVQTLFSAYLIRRMVVFPNPLERLRDVGLILAFGGPVGCLLNASTSIFLLSALGENSWSAFGHNWFIWWVGDTLGVICFTPVLLLVFAPVAISRTRKVYVTAVMLLAFGVTLSAYWYAREASTLPTGHTLLPSAAAATNWQLWSVLVGGLSFTTLLSLLMLTTTAQTDLVRRQVVERTAALEAETKSRQLSQARLRAFFTAIPDLAFIINEDGRYIEILVPQDVQQSPEYNRLAGALLQDIFPQELVDQFHQHVLRTLDSGRSQMLHYALQTNQGKRYFEGRTSPIAETLDGKRAVIWIAYDITERRWQEVLALSRDQVRQEVWRMKNPHDIQRLITAVRTSMERLEVPFKYFSLCLIDPSQDPPEIAFYNPQTQRRTPVDNLEIRRIMKQIWQRGEPAYRPDILAEDVYGELPIIAGREKTQLGSPDRRALLDVPFYFGSVSISSETPHAFSQRDIDTLVALAAILREGFQRAADMQTLETTVVQLQKANDQLQARAVDLERINRELDDFAYAASHDLKSPLRAVEGLVQLIDKSTRPLLPPQKHEYLELMRGRVRRMNSLLDDLLTYTRAGRTASPKEQLDIGELIHDIIETLAPPPGFALSVAADLPTITVEVTPLRQVFAQLIGNAIKHHDRSDGRIKIDWTDRSGQVEFSVTDDGPGIPAALRAKAFGIFQTLQSRDVVEGSGMGLALVKKIIEHQGGTIELTSTQQRGASFRFTWPKG